MILATPGPVFVFGGVWPIGCKSTGQVFRPLPELTPEAGAGVDVAGLVSRASLGLEVPSPTIRLAPEPEWNQWQVLAVGLPIWLWTADVDPQSAATSQEGIDIAMQATAGGAVVDWGDGTVGYCATMTPRARVADPVLKSPDCGHVYEHPGDYTITVTQYWGVDWAALGQQGRLELQSAASRVLPIRNFSSVVVG